MQLQEPSLAIQEAGGGDRAVRQRTPRTLTQWHSAHSQRPSLHRLLLNLKLHDAATFEHSRRVCTYALQLADSLKLMGSQRSDLCMAARLHDIGKLALPSTILCKPGRLTAEERKQVDKHPALGERMLQDLHFDRAVLAAIRGHHERYDGTGYPDGLRGADIPLLARILSIADSFDAMTSSRYYRSELSREDAMVLLQSASGTQFDPELAMAFMKTQLAC